MKKIYCLIAAIFSASIISAEEPQEMQVHGPVKSISNETYGFSMKFGELVQDDKASVGPTYYFYNNGKLAVVSHISFGTHKVYDKYTYDNEGRITEITKPDDQIGNITYVYGDEGLKEINEFDKYGLKYKTKFYYKDGIKSSIKYKGNGEPNGPWCRTVYLYDKQKYPKEEYQGYMVMSYEDNKIIQEKVSGIGGGYTTYQYNTHGYLEKEITKTVLDEEKTYTYKYDEYGNWIECKIQQKKETLSGIETTYTLQKRKIEYADTKDFIFEDPEQLAIEQELKERARQKHILDSIEQRRAYIQDSIQARKDSIRRAEQEKREKEANFAYNTNWIRKNISGSISDVTIDADGNICVPSMPDIAANKYSFYKSGNGYNCYLGENNDICFMCFFNNYYTEIVEAYLMIDAHSKSMKNYQLKKKAIKKLNSLFK